MESLEYYSKSYVESLNQQIQKLESKMEELEKEKNKYLDLCDKWETISNELFNIVRK